MLLAVLNRVLIFFSCKEVEEFRAHNRWVGDTLAPTPSDSPLDSLLFSFPLLFI